MAPLGTRPKVRKVRYGWRPKLAYEARVELPRPDEGGIVSCGGRGEEEKRRVKKRVRCGKVR